MKCDGTRAETRFHLSAKRTSPFKSARASVQSTTGSRGVRISGSNAGYTMSRGSVKGTGYQLQSPGSPSLPLPVRHRVPSHFHWSLQNKSMAGQFFTNSSSLNSSNGPLDHVAPSNATVAQPKNCPFAVRARLKRDGTRAETRFGLSTKRTSPFKTAGGVSSVEYWQPRCAHQR